MNFKYVVNTKQFPSFVSDLNQSKIIGLDVESTDLDIFTATWLLLQIKANNNIYIFDVQKLGIENMKYVVQMIQDSNVRSIGHNIKFDMKIILHNTDELLLNVYDTMTSESLIFRGIKRNIYPFRSYYFLT